MLIKSGDARSHVRKLAIFGHSSKPNHWVFSQLHFRSNVVGNGPEEQDRRVPVQSNFPQRTSGWNRTGVGELSISAAGTCMAIDTVLAGLGRPRGVAAKMRSRTERLPEATVKLPNYRTPSACKSRWRQQLCQPASGDKAQIWIEIPALSSLANTMAYAEQQRWVTVQEKTFTKWLNTKLVVRNLEVRDLVHDLSDGVCPCPPSTSGPRKGTPFSS